MKTALYILSSLSGEHSSSNKVVTHVKSKLQAKYPAAKHQLKDLALHPLPHITLERIEGESSGEHHLALLKSAEVIVIGAPMYNFGISSTLKAWIDRVVKCGETFEYTAKGSRGLLAGKKALIVVSTGDDYRAEDKSIYDHVSRHLVTVLNFIGITDVTVIPVHSQGIESRKEEALQESIASATSWANSIKL